MDTELARTFLSVVASGNFVKAAERLFVTQSTVSARIQSLEQQLGCQLFVRGKAGTTLTPAGRQFQKHATTLLRTVELARQDVGIPQGFRASLTIGARIGIWEGLLLDALAPLRAGAPDVAIRAELGFEEDLMTGLVEGRIDIGVMYTPQSRPGLHVELLLQEDLVLVSTASADPGHPGSDYVYVDWGPEFAAKHNTSYPEFTGAGLSANVGWLGLQHLLQTGGAGYFPRRLTAAHVAAQRLHEVAGAPLFHLPAYLVYPQDRDRAVFDPALDIIRGLAVAELMIKRLAFAFVPLALSLLAAACSPSGPVTPDVTALEVSQPEGWDEDLTLPEAEDLNPDPHILEINLVAKIAEVEILPGKKTMAWTYNGTVPGPLLRAQMGDRLIVHFKNELPEATTIHWHGVRVPNEMDGAPGMTQAAIESGATFEYEFTLKDAGTYWYHPHIDSSAQVGRGLYGGIVVEDPADPPALGDELVLMFSDIGLTDAGELLPSDTGGNFGDLFGREGGVLLVNGKMHPTLKVRNGKQQRWRVINAARARYFSLRLRDQKFIVLGGDNGLAERSSEVYRIVITPGERADLVFTPTDMPGTSRMLSWLPPDRGYGSQYARAREDLLMLETVDLPPVAPAPIPEHLRDIEPIDLAGATEHTLNLTIMSASGGGVTMGINGIPFWDSKPMMAHIGETQIWTLVNETDFAHPFHLHGFFFRVLDDTRVPEWKDTVDVPSKTQLRIAIKFDERPGMWMFHCHILDHAEVGMMGHLHVMP